VDVKKTVCADVNRIVHEQTFLETDSDCGFIMHVTHISGEFCADGFIIR